MCEVAPGMYSAQLTKSVRERIWQVVERWHPLGADRSAVMVWPDNNEPGGQGILTIGTTRYEVVPWQGAAFVRRDLTDAESRSLTIEDDQNDPVPF